MNLNTFRTKLKEKKGLHIMSNNKDFATQDGQFVS